MFSGLFMFPVLTLHEHISSFQMIEFRNTFPDVDLEPTTRDPFPDEVVDMLRELLHSLLSEMSQKLYSHAWVVSTEFYQHYQTVHVNLLVSTACIALFISFPWPKGLAPATIHSYLSALTYVHKIQGH